MKISGTAMGYAAITVTTCLAAASLGYLERQNVQRHLMQSKMRQVSIEHMIGEVVYARDDRIMACFAFTNFNDDGEPQMFTYVPCSYLREGGLVMSASEGPGQIVPRTSRKIGAPPDPMADPMSTLGVP